ncbi:FAD-dependent oxidoreductase [Saccharibacillus sp. CPCC 101409]|uniref:FAD-dependent oxidoreductase n=1 Tax=Saccharibacillus sp. CPCC 101409 TaxID=3058041 RepID=UPI0026738BAC|nr:FAD-dependent oxidoreductase [Saccharibacillus sp. CPCC 101409]MDO3411859.1 FAD-dependent oxidoreductase [Saccharibacillus sp. CPCC 101409]
MDGEETIRTDVLVVGGGTAGCVAALAAAGEGASVVLAEYDCALGGVATRGGIHRYYYGSPGGLQEEIDRRAEETARVFGGTTKGFHPDAKRTVLAAMCEERGVSVYTDSAVYGVLARGGTIEGVRALTPAGRLEIRAGVTIDCTGNAHVVRMAGGRLRYGRGLDGIYHNYSLIPRGLVDGRIGYDNLDAGWVDPYDPWDVSEAFERGREWIEAEVSRGKRYFGISSMLGVREGGLIEGDATLDVKAYIEDTPLPDAICRSYSHLDNHGFDTGSESPFSQLWIGVLGLFVKGLWCDIPYGALLPRGLDGILVAGRALSVERDVGMGVRMQKDMHKVGEAAGVAAALGLRAGCTPRELGRQELRRRLVELGVLEAGDLNRAQGRNLRFRSGPLAGLEESPDRTARRVPELIGYLDTDERWKAIRLLTRSGEAEPDTVLRLIGTLESGNRETQFCAAIVLCMLGRSEAASFLLGVINARLPGKLSDHPKCVPLWIAAFVLLRLLQSPAAAAEAAAALAEGASAAHSTYLLDYLCAISPRLAPAQRASAAYSLKEWLGRPGTGRDYRMHGEREESLRWSLELRAAAFLAGCPGEEETVRAIKERAAANRRSYVRLAAAKLLPDGGEDRSQEGGADTGPTLGEFEAAVIGGTAAGVICALTLGRAGMRTVLIESGSGLLTETTGSRMTRFPGEKDFSAPEHEILGAWIARLRSEGALGGIRNPGEAEPVRLQLTVDRLLREAGVSVLYEHRLLSEEAGEDGRTRLHLAGKNGPALLMARQSADCRTTAEKSGTQCATLTALLLNADSELGGQEVRRPVRIGADKLDVRLRPGFYPGEAYLDICRNLPSASGDSRAAGRLEAFVPPALEALRRTGAVPANAVLAYIADRPRPCSPENTCASGFERELEEADIKQRFVSGLQTAGRMLEKFGVEAGKREKV